MSMLHLHLRISTCIKGIFSFLIKSLFIGSLFFCAINHPVFAIPQGGTLVKGQAVISAPDANAILVNQTSQKAVINWQSYNIGANQRVNYQQPNSQAITLNRINPNNGVSSIQGRLTANGQVWLINPAGIWFGPNAYVNVGGLLASTADISDDNFMSGNYKFIQSPDWNGVIVNEGFIETSKAGLVALIGSGVVNNGLIEANAGTVILASGSEFTVNFSGNDLVGFTVDKETIQAPVDRNGNVLKDSVRNAGKIVAQGGKIMMEAKTAGQILDHAINMSGIAEAKSVGVKNGEIILMGNEGTVRVTGKIIATGKTLSEKGGSIIVTSKKVIIDDHAIINASGNQGGGKILIGGDYQGKNSAVRNAQQTYIGRDVTLASNADNKGNGGKIIVWSNDKTHFYGSATARGGEESGNGGFIEISGKDSLSFDGQVDTYANNGLLGTLLLDPKFIVVMTAGGAAYSNGVNNLFANDAAGTDIITPASINAANANIILQANTDVTFTDALAMTNNTRTLTVQAGRSILINNTISTTNGAITMTANDSAAQSANRDTGAGSIIMSPGSSLSSGTGAMTLTVGSSTTAPFQPGDISLLALTTTGAISVSTPGAVTLGGALNSGAAATTINVNTDGSGADSFIQNAGATITTTNATASAVAINVNAAAGGTGGIDLGANISTGSGGRITLSTNTGANSTGGSILQSAGVLSVGAGTLVFSVPTASASSIGASAASPISTTSTATLTLTSGSGGAFVTNTGNLTLAAPTLATNNPLSIISSAALTLPAAAISTGTGDLTLRSNGGALTVAGSLTTSSGIMTLVGSTALTLNAALLTTNGDLSLSTTTSGGITQNAAGTITSTSGNLTMTARDAITLAAAINTGSGTVTLNANTDGAGANNFAMNAGSSITNTNTSSNAVAITANVAGAGTGTIALRSITTGSGGTISITQNAANVASAITQVAATALDTGTNGVFNILTRTAGTNAIGALATNILTTSNGGTLNLTVGSGGAFVTNTGNLTLSAPTVVSANYPLRVISTAALTLPAATISTGTGALTLRSDGGALTSAGNLTTGTGALTLVGATGLSINHILTSSSGPIALGTSTSGNVSLNSSGSIVSTSGALTVTAIDSVILASTITEGSGTIAINANTDGNGNAGFNMNTGSGVTTTNATATAIAVKVNTVGGGTGAISLDGGNITAGTTGRITLATNTGGNTTGGSITQSSGILSVSGAGSFVLSTPIAGTSEIGSLATPISTSSAGGTLTLTAGSGGAYVTNTGNLTLATPTLATNSPLQVISSATLTLPAAAIATGTGDLTLRSNGGALTIAGSLTTTSGLLTLSGNTLITLNAALLTDSGDMSLSTVTSGAITQNAGGTITSTSGNLLMSAKDAATLGAAINTGSGTISINANTDGAGANSFSMGAASSITTSNVTSNAVAIIVNASGTGTGTAALRNITTGSGGTISVTHNGANIANAISQTAATALNVGTNGVINLAVTTGSTNAIGALATNILTTSSNGLLNLTLGSGGAFVTNTGDLTLAAPTVVSANYPLNIISSNTLTLPATSFSTGTGALTLRSNGGTLSTSGNLITGTGVLTLVGATGLNINSAVTTGSGTQSLSTTTSGDVTLNATGSIASTSGALTINAIDNVILSNTINQGSALVTINANTNGSGSEGLIMNSGSSITTTNTTATAVGISVNTAGGGTGGAQLANITTGNGGTITVTTATGGNTQGGSITQLSGHLLNANATGATALGSVILTTPTTNTSGIGTLALPIQTRAGAALTLNTGSSGAFVNNTANGSGYNGSTALGASTISGAFNLTSAGNITQVGATTLTIGDIATFTLGSANTSITLGNANTFSSTPIFTNNGNILDITYRNIAASAVTPSLPASFRNLSLTFNNAAMVLPDVTLSGTLIATTGVTGGSITQSGPLVVTGTSTLVAGTTNDIILDNVNNNFSTVATTSGNNVTLVDANTLNLGTSTVTGDFNVTAGAALTDSGNIIVTGTNGLIVNAATGIVLNSAGNQIAKLHLTNTSSGNVQIISIVPLTVTAFSQTGAGTVSLSDTGTLTIPVGVTVNSGSTLALTVSDLDLSGTTSSTGATTITQTSAVGLGSVGIGAAVGTLTIDNAELQKISASTLTIATGSAGGVDGNIVVDDVSPADFANIAGLTTLTATAGTTGSITFQSNPSTFKTLSATADANINVNENIFTSVGAMNFTVNTGSFNIANTKKASTAAINTAINITAQDIDLLGTLDSGTATTTITQNTVGGSLALGLTAGTMSISGSELQNIVSDNLSLIAPSNGQIIVDGITSADSANVSGTITLTATAGTLGSISFINNPSSFRTLSMTADTDINVNSSLATTIGALTLVSNGGFINVANGATASTAFAHTNLNITATDINLAATGLVDSGTGITSITQNTASGSIGLGNTVGTMTLSGAELQNIFAGTLLLNAPTNGQILIDGITVANSANITTLSLLATAGTLGTITALTSSSTFANIVTAQSDGIFTINDGVTLGTNNSSLSITALDLNLNTTGAINSGLGNTTIAAVSGVLGIGNTAGTMTISGDTLQRITANNLLFTNSNNGQITVDGITAANSANANTITLNATTGNASNIVFQNNASYFNSLVTNSTNNTTVNSDITTTIGDLTLHSNTQGPAGPLTLHANLNSADNIVLTAPGSGIILSNPVIMTALNTVTLSNIVNGANPLTINAATAIFQQAVGASTALASVVVNGSTEFSNNVTTTGAQQYSGPIILAANSTLTSTGAGNIIFGNTINGAFTLNINTAGITSIGGDIGGITPLVGITTNAPGSLIINASNIETSGTQTYNDAITVATDSTLTSNSGNIVVANSVDSAVDNTNHLVVDASAGSVTLGGVIGASNRLSNLTVNASSNLTISNAINVASNINLTSGGSIQQTGIGSLNAASLIAAAETGINLTGNNAVASFTSANNTSGNIAYNNSGNLLTIAGITQNAGNIVVTQSGALTTSGAISTNGGTIDLTTTLNNNISLMTVNAPINSNGGSMTLTADNASSSSSAIIINALLSSTPGAGGILSASGGVSLNVTPTLGTGNITLNGNGSNFILNTPLNLLSSHTFNVTGYIVINSALTSVANASIVLNADQYLSGTGGVLVTNNGSIVSGGDLSIYGSSLQGLTGFDNINPNASIQIQKGGSIRAAGNLVLANHAISLATVIIDGMVQANGNLNIFTPSTAQGIGNSLTVSGNANIGSRSFNSNLNVGSLTLNIQSGNMYGTINGLSGINAIRLITFLNTVLPGTIFFDNIDVYAVLNPKPGINQLSNFNNTTAKSATSDASNTGTFEINKSCVIVSPIIQICGMP